MQLPLKRDEIKGKLGGGGGHTDVNEHGLVSQNLFELSKAEE